MTKKTELIQKIKSLGKGNPISPRNDPLTKRQRGRTVDTSQPATSLENCKNEFAWSTRPKSASFGKSGMQKSVFASDRGKSSLSRQTKVAVDVSNTKPTKGITALRDQNFVCNFEKKPISKNNTTLECFESDDKEKEDHAGNVRLPDECPINENSNKKPDSSQYQGCRVGQELMNVNEYSERRIFVKPAESCTEESPFKKQIICGPKPECFDPTQDIEERRKLSDGLSPTFSRPEPIGRNFSCETNVRASIGSDKSRGYDSKQLSDTRSILRPEPIGQEAERISKSAEGRVEPSICNNKARSLDTVGFINSEDTNFDASLVNMKGRNVGSGKVAYGLVDGMSVETREGDSKPSRKGKMSFFRKTRKNKQILDGSKSTSAATAGNIRSTGNTRFAVDTRFADDTRSAANIRAAEKAEKALQNNFEIGTRKCDIHAHSNKAKDVGCTRKKHGKSAAKETEWSSDDKERKTKLTNALFSSIRERMGNISCIFQCGNGNISKHAQVKSQSLEELQNPITKYQLPKAPTNISVVELQTPKPYSAPPIRKFPVISDDAMTSKDIHKSAQKAAVKDEKCSLQRTLSADRLTWKRRKRVENWLQRQQCRPILLRGQVKYIEAWSMVLFIGTPL